MRLNAGKAHENAEAIRWAWKGAISTTEDDNLMKTNARTRFQKFLLAAGSRVRTLKGLIPSVPMESST